MDLHSHDYKPNTKVHLILYIFQNTEDQSELAFEVGLSTEYKDNTCH